MQGIQKLWFKVILAIQTEVQTNITRQKDRSILLFDVFAVGNIIPYHCLLKYTKTWRILWDCLQAMDTTHSLLHYSYDSSLVFLKLSHDHYQYLWEKKSWFPWKLSISSFDSENGKEDGPGIPTARKGGRPRYSHSTHSILSDNGRSGSSTKDEGEVDNGSQHTFPSNQQEV